MRWSWKLRKALQGDAMNDLSAARNVVRIGPPSATFTLPPSGCCGPVVLPAQSQAQKSAATTDGQRWFRLGLAAAIATNAMLVNLAVSSSEVSENTMLGATWLLVLSAVSVAALTKFRLVTGLRDAIRSGNPGLESLFLLSIVASLVLSVHALANGHDEVWFDVASMLMVLHAVGHEAKTQQRQRLLTAFFGHFAAPEQVHALTCCGNVRDKPANEVRPGDRILVRAGEVMPLDGFVCAGTCYLQSAALNGEPFPFPVQEGDLVTAGTLVTDASVQVEVTQAMGTRHVDRVTQLLQAAILSPSSTERHADHWLRGLLVLVPSIAAFAAFGPVLWGAPVQWERGLATVVVACPCALGFALPLSRWFATSALARAGLWLRRPDALQDILRLHDTVFDKTGTMTDHQLTVSVVEDRAPHLPWLAMAAALERYSAHAVAVAFHALSTEGWIATGTCVQAGKGVSGELTHPGRAWPDAEVQVAHIATQDARRLLQIVVDGQTAGVVELHETPRPNVSALLDALRERHLHLHVLTGDPSNRAGRLGVANTRTGVTPDEKWAYIADLESSGQRALVVGDGWNDLPAMSRATVSIAVADSPAGDAQGADLIWDGRDAMALLSLFEIADRLRRQRHALYAWLAVYNGVAMALAATGWIHPIVGGVLMTVSSLSVVILVALWWESDEAGEWHTHNAHVP
jgi:P-type E1-E2 ATPase